MDLNAVMDGLGVRLRTIDGLRVFDYPPDKVSPPAAVIGFPDIVTYDAVYAGGADVTTIPVYVLIAPGTDRVRRDELARYAYRVGALSVKAAVEGDVTLGGSAQTVRVQRCEFTSLTVADLTYPTAQFDVEVCA